MTVRYLAFFFVDYGAHVHVADVRMVVVVVCQGGVMGGEAAERECMSSELMQDGTSYSHSVLNEIQTVRQGSRFFDYATYVCRCASTKLVEDHQRSRCRLAEDLTAGKVIVDTL